MSPASSSTVTFAPSRVSSPSRISTYSATLPSWPPKAPAGPADRAVGEHGERRRPVEEEVLAQPEPAAEAPRAVGVVDEREPHDAHRVVELRLLDGRVLGVLAVRLHRVRAVALEPPAVAAAERLEEADVLVRDRVDAAEAGVAHHRLRPGGERAGSAGRSARKMMSTRRVCVSQPPTTGDGQVQFVTLPLGASRCTSR